MRGKLITLTTKRNFLGDLRFGVLTLAKASLFLTPIVLSPSLQLLTYYIAVHRYRR